MGIIKFHEIWIEQCKAARDIKFKFGLKAAFDYTVKEKLLDYMNAAARHPQFAQELPRFVATVRQMFKFEETREQIIRVERELQTEINLTDDRSGEANEDDDIFLESPVAIAERTRRFDIVKELLTAPELGTS
jgi:hypothetical protein